MPKILKKVEKVTKKEKAPKKGAYLLEVVVNDENYKGQANDLLEALQDFVSSPSFPAVIKTRVVIRCSHGESDYRWVMPTFMARRMFKMIEKKPTALELFASRLVGRLD